MELICITCPNGCHLTVTGEGEHLSVTGNLCPRGIEFARAELTHPTRSLTTTVRTVSIDYPLLPVRTEGEIPKELISEAMRALRHVTVSAPVRCGEPVVENLLGCGVRVIATAHFMP